MSDRPPILNEMLDRPIVDERVLAFMRTSQARFEPVLDQIQQEATERRVPIIPHETAVFLDFVLGILNAKQILEIGTAIGFSAGVMALGDPGRQIETIDRNPVMYQEAQANFQKLGIDDRVQIITGDAVEILPTLTKNYDFIFMDSAKAKYYDFLPLCVERLRVGGVLLIDDVFQGGTVFDEIETIPRRNRTIHKKLRLLLDRVYEVEGLSVSALPLGDGVLLIKKLQESIDFSDWI